MRGIIPILLASFCLSSGAVAQTISPSPSTRSMSVTTDDVQDDFKNMVVPITSIRITPSLKFGSLGPKIGPTGIGPDLGAVVSFGTGFCLDPRCRFIATNYHVAATMRPGKIKGDQIVQRYFATGPEDHDATANFVEGKGALAFAKSRDLAIFELERPLPHHHGLGFSLDELEPGQEVDIYSYPMVGINPFRKLIRFPAKFKGPTTSGLLAFDSSSPIDKPITGGASGGIVVDRQTQKIVGILEGAQPFSAVNGSTSITTVGAVSIQNLAEFVAKAQPFLAHEIFPAIKEISPISKDLYPKFVPPRSDELQRRQEESREVSLLRQKAQALADSIRNFVAVQSFAWGKADKDPEQEALYEVQVLDGRQRFRSYPEGKKQLDEVPEPYVRRWVTPADEWAELPKMVATEFRLKVQQAQDAVIAGRPMKVFQYFASVEDNLCPFESIGLFGGRPVAVACYGEVWTDQDMNIIRMSERLDMSDKLKAYGGWRDFSVVITYGWMNRWNDISRLVPLTIYTEAINGNHLCWCRGYFTDYHMFNTDARLVTN